MMDIIQNSTLRVTILEDWEIDVVEKHLESHLKQCTIWGDLNINYKEYEYIKAKIDNFFGDSPTILKLKHLIRQYPAVIVTDMINFILFEFDNNKFWNGWASRYNVDLSHNNQAEIGRMVLTIFEKFNFEIIEDGGYAYVTPILCQAGIPSVCCDKLFDIFDSTINSMHFNAREIVNELMGYRNYLIDAPVERYFRWHTEKAIELIVQLREMMRSVGELSGIESSEIPEVLGVPQRIVSRYAHWTAEIKRIGRRSRKNTQFYFSPKLVYEETKGICLYLPEQTLRDDSIYKLRWSISSVDLERDKIVYAQVYNHDGRNYTLETYIPLASASRYTVELYDDDDDANPLTNSWTIEVFANNGDILAFNEAGSLMSPTQRYISRKGTIIVFDSRTTIEQIHNTNYVDISLPRSWAEFQAIRVYPSDKDAFLSLNTADEIYRVECKPSFDLELEQTGILFDEKYNYKETPVYTCFPAVEISGDIPNDSQAIFNNWQIIISHRFSNTKHVVLLSELSLAIAGDNARVSLANYAQKYFANIYGAYELRIHDGKTTLKNFTFYFAPTIRYIAHIEELRSDRSFERKNAAFYVHKKDSSFLEFEPGSGINVLPVASKSNDLIEISTTNKQAYIYGSIIAKDGQRIPFKKTIRKLEWSFWDERENDVKDVGKTKQFYLEDFKATNWRLGLHFTDAWEQYDSIKLVLETADHKQLQSKDINVDNFGNCSITLNMFQDTIAQHSLPQRLMLYITKGYDDYLPICIAVIRSFVQLNNPKYTMFKDNPLIYWDKIQGNQLLNKRLELISLDKPFEEPIQYTLNEAIKSFKDKEGKVFEGILIGNPLQDSTYYIDAKEDIEFSFFDDEEQEIPIYDNNHVLCVNGKGILEKHYATNTNNIAAWLSAVVTAQNRTDWISELTERLKERIERRKMVFVASECSPILFSLLINIGEKSNLALEKKQKVQEICTLINDYVITNSDRLELLKFLLDSSVSNEDCKKIISELQLYLFCPNDSIVFDKPLLHRMWDINEQMAILMNLRNSVTALSVDIDRVVGRIGSETLGAIIRFNHNESCGSNDWFECFERIIGNKCNCKNVSFENSKRVWGDGSEYSKLFVSDKRGNWSREEPEDHHTDSYHIFGRNYLKLIYDLTPEIQDDKSKEYTKLAKKEIYKVEELSAKYTPLFHNLQYVLQNRLGDGSGLHKLFYQIGCASILNALATKKVIDPTDLQELLPFWRYATANYAELVYRDLIMSELYALQSKGRS